MKTLFVENDVNFTSEMLLGALIDMGASVCYIENMLKNSGFEAKIYHDTVVRDGTEAEFAYVKCERADDMRIDDEIKTFICSDTIPEHKNNDQAALFLAVLYAINCFFPDNTVCLSHCGKNTWDSELLKCISVENNGFVAGDIVCVGYGAGEQGILRVVLYSEGSGIEFVTSEEQLNLQIS